MVNNRIELSKDAGPKVLITWHMPREDGLFYPLAFQFSDEVDDETKKQMLEIAKRPLKIPEKQYKSALFGSSDHFEALARPLGRMGYRTRYFGYAQHDHPLQDRPIEEP